MKRKQILPGFIALFLALFFQVPAQVVITNDSTAADSSAMLDVKSTTKGVAIPRLTVEQIRAIPNPAIGLVVFCTSDDQFYTYTGSDTVSGKTVAGGGVWKLTGGTTAFLNECYCISWGGQSGPGPFPYTYEQTLSFCNSDPVFNINCPLGVDHYYTGPGPFPVSCWASYAWTGATLPPPAWSSTPVSLTIDPSMLTCGKYTYTFNIKVWGNILCHQDYTVYIFPECLTIEKLTGGVPGPPHSSCTAGDILEFCRDQEGRLSSGCAEFPLSWEYSDNGAPFLPWNPPTTPTPYTDDPIYLNFGNITSPSSCPSTSPATDCYLQRTYRATLTKPAGWPAWPSGCPNQNVLTIPAKIYYPSMAGLNMAYLSHPYTVSGNTYKVCSDKNADCIPDYPVDITPSLWQRTGHITNGSPNGIGNQSFSVYAPGTYEYWATVQNGPAGTCGPDTKSIWLIVEDPFCPEITNTREWACPDKTEDIISLLHSEDLPPGATIQWYYQINCVDPWYPADYVQFGPSNGYQQNTNMIGSLNPWYNPVCSSLITESLCWKVEITPAAGSACTAATSSRGSDIEFPNGKIKLIKKPGKPAVNISPPPPRCCGTNFLLTASTPVTGTPPFSYEWYHNGQIIGAGSSINVTAPGDYFVRVYNRNRCDWTQSDTTHLTCCSVNLNVTADCCSDGVTPMTLVASATSTCGNVIGTYTWNGPNGYSFTSTSPVLVLDPPPTFPPGEWIYTVTARDAMLCQSTTTVIILACP